MKRESAKDLWFPAAVASAVVLGAGPVFAQATGQVAVSSGPTGSSRSLESLQQLLLSPPDPKLNVFVTPQFSYEKFDAYNENGSLQGPVLVDDEVCAANCEVQDLVRQPEFTIETAGITGGGDYLFPNGLLLGASFTYNHADYDFKTESREDFAANALTDPDLLIAGFSLGEPLDRNFDEYGATFAAGYIKDPYTILLTGGISRRENIDTLRREFNGNVVTSSFATAQEIVQTKGNTDSDLYSVELGLAYRFSFQNMAIQPLASIGYQREEVDSYTEDFEAAFQRPIPSKFNPPQQFVQVGQDAINNPDGSSRSTVRKFDDQTIESVPLRVGALFTTSFADPDADITLSNLSLGATYTHDFDDQKRTVNGDSINFPNFSVKYEEQNRNQDYMSVTGAVDFRIAMVRGTFTYQQDIGFDERERAHVFRLQARVPLSF